MTTAVLGPYGDWWTNQLFGLSKKFPAWAECFDALSENYLRCLAYEMSHLEPLAPCPEHVFRPFADLCPDQIKILILGQDPYPTPGMACGRAFAISSPEFKISVSLRNLHKALNGTCDFTLQQWVDQGVFLLNASPILTVPKCVNLWVPFTRHVITWLMSKSSEHRKLTCVFMGRDAEALLAKCPPNSNVKIIVTPHPAERTGKFVQSNLLEQLRDANIRW